MRIDKITFITINSLLLRVFDPFKFNSQIILIGTARLLLYFLSYLRIRHFLNKLFTPNFGRLLSLRIYHKSRKNVSVLIYKLKFLIFQLKTKIPKHLVLYIFRPKIKLLREACTWNPRLHIIPFPIYLTH